MQNTGKVDEYLAISSDCRPCRATADRIAGIYANGGHVTTDGWTIRRVLDRSSESGEVVLDLEVDSSPTTYVARRRGEVRRLPGGSVVMRVRLNGEAPWQVLHLTQVPS